MQEVFGAELELESVLAPGGFGGIKMTGQPLPQCQFSVVRAYEGSGPAYDCVKPRLFDCTDQGPAGLLALDLRNALARALRPSHQLGRALAPAVACQAAKPPQLLGRRFSAGSGMSGGEAAAIIQPRPFSSISRRAAGVFSSPSSP